MNLLDILKEGKENGILGEDLEIALQVDKEKSHYHARTVIRKAILVDKIPIGSGKGGFFLISNEQEFDAIISDLWKKINGIKKRIEALKEGWKKRQKGKVRRPATKQTTLY